MLDFWSDGKSKALIRSDASSIVKLINMAAFVLEQNCLDKYAFKLNEQ